MKKRFFSSLLMGALVTATLSTVTSCKDYDDDINGLQEQINKLATADQLQQKVDELKGLISANSTSITTLQSDIAKKTTLDEVKTLLANSDYATKKYVDDADAILDAAIKAIQTKDIKDLQDAVAKAQKAAEDAQATANTAKEEAELANSKDSEAYKKAVEAAESAQTVANNLAALEKSIGAGYSETSTVKDAIAAINNLLKAENTGLSGLNSRLESVEETLKNAEDGTTLNVSKKLTDIENALKNIIGQYSTMVTDIQLFHNNAKSGKFDNTLDFIQTTEVDNGVFQAFGTEDEDNKFTFTKGGGFLGQDSVLVRVSPVDAELTKENVSLINSQGKELNDLIDITSVKRFKGLLTSTRAAASETGLWVVKFKPKSIGDDFVAAAVDNSEGYEKSILYAVAVKNTYNTDKENTRRVTSEYDLSLYTEVAAHGLDFTVNNKSINEIHNRYYLTDTGESTRGVKELVWLDPTRPFMKVHTANDENKNAEDRWNSYDERQNKNMLSVEKDKPITIDYTTSDKAVNIKGFYVTLDNEFALESAPSELNAWTSYEYQNVGYTKANGEKVPAKLFKGNSGSIVIKDMNKVQGDVIGFRVYAVNYDGTLVDPDGRSFYVAVGNVKTSQEIATKDITYKYDKEQFETGLIDAKNAFDVDFDRIKPVADYNYPSGTYGASNGWLNVTKDDDAKYPVFTVKYFDANKNEVSISAGKDIKYVQYVLPNATNFIDGATYTQSIVLQKQVKNTSTYMDIKTIKVSLKKVMPTAPEYSFIQGQNENQYMIPEDNSYVIGSTPKVGKKDFVDVFCLKENALTGFWTTDLKSDGKFLFTVVDAYGTGKNAKVTPNTVSSNYSYLLRVPAEQISNGNNGKTVAEHKILSYYTYNGISKRKDTNGNYVTAPYYLPGKESNIKFLSWTSENSVKFTLPATKNTVKWLPNPTATSASTISLADFTATSSYDPTTFNEKNLKGYVNKNWLQIKDIYTSTAEKEDVEGAQKNPYFTPYRSGDNIIFEQSNQASAAPTEHKEWLHLTYADCFGQETHKAFEIQIKK